MPNYGADVPADINDRLRSDDNRPVVGFRAQDTNTELPRRLSRTAGKRFESRESLRPCLGAEAESGRSRPSTRSQGWRPTGTMTAAARRRPLSYVSEQVQQLRQVHRVVGRIHARQPSGGEVRGPPRGGSAAGTEMRRLCLQLGGEEA
jgi:hypothetical protein